MISKAAAGREIYTSPNSQSRPAPLGLGDRWMREREGESPHIGFLSQWCCQTQSSAGKCFYVLDLPNRPTLCNGAAKRWDSVHRTTIGRHFCCYWFRFKWAEWINELIHCDFLFTIKPSVSIFSRHWFRIEWFIWIYLNNHVVINACPKMFQQTLKLVWLKWKVILSCCQYQRGQFTIPTHFKPKMEEELFLNSKHFRDS